MRPKGTALYCNYIFSPQGADEKGDQRSLRRRQSMEVSPCKSEEESPAKSPFRPTLWLVVDPNIVIPCPEVHPPREPHPTPTFSPDAKARPRADCSTSDDEALTSTGEPCTEDDRWSASSPPGAPLRRVGSQVPKAPCKTWPRPPINYCTLISLALWNSEDGSLNVQQIYSFVREHFPFFRAAPDGWKNTVRHNLCFSSSFEKSSGWACTDGPRRSCLWKLTRLGSRKFRAEIKILTDDLLHVLRRSMNKPGLMDLLFGM
ncbi:hypothetical protein GDO78_011329 [Eleutherodactylus coqui]|uniref:Fork-head domain-containing protein n=2 Tax=Eleutherodactylus coqui TaxID=57060 RepID=A0A8J6F8P8_ELECQ|nr:hypothetical protein GDO78_011329 [Eleutherodactylus coqui]